MRITLFGLFFFVFLPAWTKSTLPQFKLLTTQAGLYRVTYEELAAAGLSHTSAAQLGLFNQGKPVPIHMNAGSDGLFGSGDWFEFRAETLRGDLSYHHEYSPYNAYMVVLEMENPMRMQDRPPSMGPTRRASSGSVFTVMRHEEVDTLLMRFHTRGFKPHEIWFWHKLSCTDKAPFEQAFDLKDLDPKAKGPALLSVNLRGWSVIGNNPAKLADHQIQVFLNDKLVSTRSWSGKDSFTLEQELPRHLLRRGENRIGLRTPRRKHQDELIIDVSILNWIQMSWPQQARIPSQGDTLFTLATGAGNGPYQLQTSSFNYTLYGDLGSRIPLHNLTPTHSKFHQLTFRGLPGERSFLAVPDSEVLAVDEVVGLRPDGLHALDQQADYLAITHPALSDAVQPLLEYHRNNGLKVTEVDIRDLYDHFNYGILHPRAIKAFIAHAYHNWQAPKPRYVLLVGDASWDTKNPSVRDENYPDLTFYPRFRTEFNKIESTMYETAEANNRNLIPTWNFFDSTGHSASDNWFACVDGDNFYPDVAIGRFPVTKPEEVRAIVDKTISYMKRVDVGPWRRNILMITNESAQYQKLTDGLAGDLAEKGFRPEKIYPNSNEKSNANHTPRIVEALDRGQYLVYFYGHGGRYIWRTGPPDHRKNHDLFTLADLDQLKPTERNPVVLSFTCFSAPFDHPGADSIGEKFLRLPDRGAVAFVGASWRNTPNIIMNRHFMESFAAGGTVGEALNRAKNRLPSRTLVETYNLMGDPAVPLKNPPGVVEFGYNPAKNLFEGRVGQWDNFSGNAIVDWLDGDGVILQSEKFQITAGRIHYAATMAPPAGSLMARCYVWNAETRRDGLGKLLLDKPVAPAAESL